MLRPLALFYTTIAVACLAFVGGQAAHAQNLGEAQQILTSSSPGINEPKTVSVGNAIHEYSRYVSYDGALLAEIMRGGQLIVPITVEAGTHLYSVDTKTKFKACQAAFSVDFDRYIVRGACGLDDDGDGTFDRMARDDASGALKLKSKVPYERIKIPVDAPNNLKQIILYQGATSDTLKLSYREFRNDLARPAFTEEMSIPITRTFPEVIAVKDIKLRLLGVSGMGLRYEVIQ